MPPVRRASSSSQRRLLRRAARRIRAGNQLWCRRPGGGDALHRAGARRAPRHPIGSARSSSGSEGARPAPHDLQEAEAVDRGALERLGQRCVDRRRPPPCAPPCPRASGNPCRSIRRCRAAGSPRPTACAAPDRQRLQRGGWPSTSNKGHRRAWATGAARRRERRSRRSRASSSTSDQPASSSASRLVRAQRAHRKPGRGDPGQQVGAGARCGAWLGRHGLGAAWRGRARGSPRARSRRVSAAPWVMPAGSGSTAPRRRRRPSRAPRGP